MESQAVQESLPLPGTDLHLVYHSARTKGYLSIIQLQLTPEETPSSLTRVHVKVRRSNQALWDSTQTDMSQKIMARLRELVAAARDGQWVTLLFGNQMPS